MKNQLKQAIIDGNADTTKALAGALLATGASAREILDEALLPGMEVVGERMRLGSVLHPGGAALGESHCREPSNCWSPTWLLATAPAWAPW